MNFFCLFSLYWHNPQARQNTNKQDQLGHVGRSQDPENGENMRAVGEFAAQDDDRNNSLCHVRTEEESEMMGEGKGPCINRLFRDQSVQKKESDTKHDHHRSKDFEV